MHSQLVARYESERLSNGMPRIVVYSNFRSPIKEGYYSKLLRNTNMRPYPGRAPNTTLSDVNRPDEDAVIRIDDNDQARSNILFAIDQGFVVAVSWTRFLLKSFHSNENFRTTVQEFQSTTTVASISLAILWKRQFYLSTPIFMAIGTTTPTRSLHSLMTPTVVTMKATASWVTHPPQCEIQYFTATICTLTTFFNVTSDSCKATIVGNWVMHRYKSVRLG